MTTLARSRPSPLYPRDRPLVSPRLIVRVCLEDLPHASNRFWILMRAVMGGNDMFALCLVYMRAPIGNDSVRHHRFGLVFVATLAAIATDSIPAADRPWLQERNRHHPRGG